MDNRIYIVEYPLTSKYAEVAPLSTGDDKILYDYNRIERCPQCGQYVSGAYWLPPRRIALTNRNTPDFLYLYGDGVPFLLSENALDKIQKEGLVGITTAEKIDNARYLRRAKKDVPIPQYYHIEVVRSKITIDHQNSVIHYGDLHEEKRCPLCNPIAASLDWKRFLSWNMEEYEGYDIFHSYELGGILFVS